MSLGGILLILSRAWKKGEGEGFFDAEIVHKVHAESLAEFASVVKTESVLEQWRGWMA